MNRMRHAIRIDRADPPRHHVNFRLAQLPVERVELPIDITNADIIEVNEGQLSYARPRQRSKGPGTAPAKPNHRHMRTAKPFEALRTVQPGKATESRFVRIH